MDPIERNWDPTLLRNRKRITSPIDRGWAWIVMLASFMTITILMGYIRTFGILFVEYGERFNASATTTSFTMGFRSIVQAITALFVHNIVLEFFSVRRVTIIGGVLFGVNIILKVFATNMIYVILTECIIAGAAHGMLFSPPFLLVGQYFKKHRSFAISFVTCGSSFGGMIFAPLLRYLLDEEGYRGALLIYGGLLLNVIPCACLFRPLKKEQLESIEAKEKDKEVAEHLSSKDVSNKIMEKQTDRLINMKYKSRSENDINEIKNEVNEYKMCVTEIVCVSTSELHIADVNNIETHTNVSNATDMADPNSPKSAKLLLLNMKNMFDIKLFLDARFLMISALAFFGPVGTILGTLLIPPLGKEMGLSETQASNILILLAALDLLSRIIIGIIADKNWIKKRTIVLITLVLTGITYQFSGFCSTVTRFVIFTVAIGIFSGAYIALINTILIDMVGLVHFSSVLGCTQLFTGISSAVSMPIFGALKDSTGTYGASYHFLGTYAILAAIILCLEPLIKKSRSKNTCL